jgi:NodT family efflux transporter outer membrane factor (OMF) lipoprotein
MTFPFDASWAPDLWGKIRNEVRSAEYGAQVSAADLANEKLTEQASLAAFYFELRGQDALIDILKKTVASDQKAYEVNDGSYKAGVGDYISVMEARSTLESAQSQLTNLRIARAQYEHAIAVLVGKVPTNFSLPPNPGFLSPPPIPVGVPSELLERRPDIAAAERTLAEANSNIGIGYGAFFPNLVLSTAGGFESSTFKHWFDWPSRFWSIGPALSQTIFNGGLYKAQLHQYTAIYNSDLAGYRQTVLTAFEQVEDNLASTRLYSQQVEQQGAALRDAEHYLQLEQARYRSGIDPYINVITAQTTVLSEQETLAAIRVNEMTSAVHLVQALGGGWNRSQLPTPKQTGKKVPKAEYALQK